MHEQVIGHHKPDIIDHTNKLALTIPLKVRHRREPGAGFHRQDQSLPMVGARRNRRKVSHRPLPSCARIIHNRAVAGDNEVALQVLRIARPTMPFHVGTAAIQSPGHINDLAADEGFIPRLADADRDVGLPFGQVENPVADHQLDPQTRMAGMKGVDERCPSEASRHARSAGHPNGARETFVTRGEVTLECRHRCLDALRRRAQFLSKRR